MQDLAHHLRLAFQLAATLADGGQVRVHRLGHVALEGAGAVIADLRRDVLLGAAGGQRRRGQ